MGRVGGQIVELPGVSFEIVELIAGARRGEQDALDSLVELALGVQFAKALVDQLVVLVGVGLQVRAVGVVVADVLLLGRADGAETFSGFVARQRNVFARFGVLAKERARLHVGGDRDGGEVEG